MDNKFTENVEILTLMKRVIRDVKAETETRQATAARESRMTGSLAYDHVHVQRGPHAGFEAIS